MEGDKKRPFAFSWFFPGYLGVIGTGGGTVFHPVTLNLRLWVWFYPGLEFILIFIDKLFWPRSFKFEGIAEIPSKGILPLKTLCLPCVIMIKNSKCCYFLNNTFYKSENRWMIEALFYGEKRPIAYGSSLINDTFIFRILMSTGMREGKIMLIFCLGSRT